MLLPGTFLKSGPSCTPWYFGGNILYGASNDILLAQPLKPNVWLSAHGEDKNQQGILGEKIEE